MIHHQSEKKVEQSNLMRNLPALDDFYEQGRLLLEQGSFEEGCLSIPGINMDVRRPAKIIIRGLTRSGRLVEINASDLLARVIQHEIDHLKGVLFIDRLIDKDKKAIEADLQILSKQYSAASP